MKIGRNDPCPCGSGKKYKKCCLDKDRAVERETIAKTAEPAKGLEYTGITETTSPFEITGLTDPIGPTKPIRRAKSTKPPEPSQEPGATEDSESKETAESSVKSPLILKLEELLERGPLRAKNAVEVNGKVPLELIENTPFIRVLQVFLESIARSGGRVPIKIEKKSSGEYGGRVDMEEELLLETAGMWPGVDPSISSKKGTSLFSLHILFVEIAANGIGLTEQNGDEIVLTEKGKAVLQNTRLRRVYSSGLNKLTYTYNWFAFSGFPDIVEDIQELVGLELFLLDYPYRNEEAVDEKNIMRQIDSIIPFIQSFSSHRIDEKKLSRLIHDYFLGTYCYLFGFVVPSAGAPSGRAGPSGKSPSGEAVSGRGQKWYVSELYHQMFQWKL